MAGPADLELDPRRTRIAVEEKHEAVVVLDACVSVDGSRLHLLAKRLGVRNVLEVRRRPRGHFRQNAV
jgi:hypothetical protein